jgi:hypothetical protein
MAAGSAAVAIAARPVRAMAAVSPDPIYAAIDQHKQTVAVFHAAVTTRSRFNDLNMDDERRKQLSLLEEAIDAAWEPCDQAGLDLITTQPATLAGMIEAIRYAQIHLRNDGIFMPQDVPDWMIEDVGAADDAKQWLDVFLRTITEAAAAIADGVQSAVSNE